MCKVLIFGGTTEGRILAEYCSENRIDLIKEHFPGREFLTTPMRQEKERCLMALETASRGKVTAMICSGDSGVYGMAGLILLLAAGFPDVEVEVIPGVTAALSGGAVLGAPLGHDFAVISLSDRSCPVKKVGDAHIKLRLLLADGNRFFAAGRIAAGSAV